MNIIKISLVFSILFFSLILKAGTYRDVTMPNEETVGGKKLVLNGMGLREVTKMMIPIKVYIGGLYIEKKSDKPDEIMSMKFPKRIKMQWLWKVGAGDYKKTWREAIKANCPTSGPNKNCDQIHDKLDAFLDLLKEVKTGDVTNYTFDDKGFEVESGGQKLGRVDSPELGQIILGGWLGSKGYKVFDEGLGQGLLGGNKI